MHCAVGQGQQRGGGCYMIRPPQHKHPFLYTASHPFVVHTFWWCTTRFYAMCQGLLGSLRGTCGAEPSLRKRTCLASEVFARCDASCRVEHRPSPSGIIGRRIAPTSGRKEVEITHLRPGDGRSSEEGGDGWAIRGQTTGYWICIPSIPYNVNAKVAYLKSRKCENQRRQGQRIRLVVGFVLRMESLGCFVQIGQIRQ
jgi:hypothetical protein